jgi:hypothetical protein
MDKSCSQLKSEGTTQLIAVNTLEFAHPLNSFRHSCMYVWGPILQEMNSQCHVSMITHLFLFGTLIAVHRSCFDLVDIMVHGFEVCKL